VEAPIASLWLQDAGHGATVIGLMSGAIVAQVPIGWLADRAGRTAVLLGCCVVLVVGLAWLPCCGVAALMIWMRQVGYCGGAFYPPGLALLSENVPANGQTRATACFLAINCLGSVIGPMLMRAAHGCVR
jgi:MFS family permease